MKRTKQQTKPERRQPIKSKEELIAALLDARQLSNVSGGPIDRSPIIARCWHDPFA